MPTTPLISPVAPTQSDSATTKPTMPEGPIRPKYPQMKGFQHHWPPPNGADSRVHGLQRRGGSTVCHPQMAAQEFSARTGSPNGVKRSTPRQLTGSPNSRGEPLFLLYSMRRIDCRQCQAVVVEEVPWDDGKRTLTKEMEQRFCSEPRLLCDVLTRCGGVNASQSQSLGCDAACFQVCSVLWSDVAI
jgi:hypothetical protein